MSGFRSGSLVHKGFYDEDIDLPSLHVYGESDSIIPKGKGFLKCYIFHNIHIKKLQKQVVLTRK